MSTKPAGTVRTAWEIWTCDVLGNTEDRSCVDRCYEIYCPATIYNVGTQFEFRGAAPSINQIKDIFGDNIEVDGEDTFIYVNNERTGKPIGELICISHDCLSPVSNSNGEWDEADRFHIVPKPSVWDGKCMSGGTYEQGSQ